MLRMAALTQGRTVGSGRFRVHQLVPALAARGVGVRVFDATFGAYPPSHRLARPAWLVATLAERALAAWRTRAFDLVLLQRELVSTLATVEPLAGRPRVLDVDDAIWLHRDGRAARRIAAGCDLVICGNSFIADWFAGQGRPVAILPTAVDAARFRPAPRAAGTPLVVGWTGSSSGFRYLLGIEDALRDVLAAEPRARVRVVADRPPPFRHLPADRVDFVRWSPETEVGSVQDMTVGIMPLEDSDWERGKCSYKMLLYMACGRPVVVSPVGMNVEVLAQGDLGRAARSMAEWRDAVLELLRDAGAAARLGAVGREIVERHYAVEPIADRLAALCHEVAGTARGD